MLAEQVKGQIEFVPLRFQEIEQARILTGQRSRFVPRSAPGTNMGELLERHNGCGTCQASGAAGVDDPTTRVPERMLGTDRVK